MEYNWQQSDWPNFRYSLDGLEALLSKFSEKAGMVSGLLAGLDHEAAQEAIVDVMISEAIKTSEIEGEYLSRQDVRSSVCLHLGLSAAFPYGGDKASLGAGELMVRVRESWDKPLTCEVLFGWHRLLMAGAARGPVGEWRTGSEPMQVISGRVDRPTVHFEAPPSAQVPIEMKRFIGWFNVEARRILHPPVRAALAHLYFETIHPFTDGNGRIGRAVAEKALSQALGRPAVLSISQSIEGNRKSYYAALQAAQRSNNITNWVRYFAQVAVAAQDLVEKRVLFVLAKAKFLDRIKGEINDRQRKVVERILREGPTGFQGGMNARKYMSLTGASKATATRDLGDLASRGIMAAKGAGRSVRYDLILFPD